MRVGSFSFQKCSVMYRARIHATDIEDGSACVTLEPILTLGIESNLLEPERQLSHIQNISHLRP